MKWLFAILVVLNIVVFGSMVAGKLVRQDHAAVTDSGTSATAVLSNPAAPNINIQSAEPVSEASTAAEKSAKASSRPENEEAHAHGKPAENHADANKDKDAAVAAPAPSAATCTATVSLPEDDFHRIKGLFSKWPFTTSRFIDKVSAPKSTNKSTNTATRTRYAVTLPASPSGSIRDQLQSQGFDYGVVQGKTSLGVFNRRSDAESLLARAKMHGLGDATIDTVSGSGNDGDNNNNVTSVAKIRVTFNDVNNAAIHDISNIVSRYGQLQHAGSCS